MAAVLLGEEREDTAPVADGRSQTLTITATPNLLNDCDKMTLILIHSYSNKNPVCLNGTKKG
jgi:hypothetical protein